MMAIGVRCECGREVTVTDDVGDVVHCSCGRAVAVPSPPASDVDRGPPPEVDPESLAETAGFKRLQAEVDHHSAEVLVELKRQQEERPGWLGAIGMLVVSLLLYTGAARVDRAWDGILILIPVLAFHELGHYVAMTAFGYRNLRMFFIPFVGAAVSGRHYNVAGWKKALVALAGPIPGIVIGAPLGVAGLMLHSPKVVEIAVLMLILNGFNLLPLLPLDGGRVLHAVLFVRHPVLDALFRLAATLGFLWLAIYIWDWILIGVGVLMLLTIPLSTRLAYVAHRLRREGVRAVSADADTIPPETVLAILAALQPVVPAQTNPKALARDVATVFETLNAKPPGFLASAGLLALHAGSFLLALVMSGVLVVLQHGPVKAPAPRELARIVSEMGRRKLDDDELETLKNAGARATPLLLAALNDEQFLFRRYGPTVLDGSAMETALDLLEPYALPPAKILEPALRQRDEYFHYHALYHLARCGNDDAIDALKQGLKSSSEDSRQWTLIGLEFLKDSRRGTKQFRAALFDAAIPLLGDRHFGPAGHAPRVLLALDLPRGSEVLLADNVFRPDNGSINEILGALKDANVNVPAAQLRNLLAGIKSKAGTFPFDYAYADGLILLARVEPAGANELIADARRWGNEKVKDGAAKAMAVAAGVGDAYAFVADLYERNGADGLTEPQLYYLTLSWLDAEVRNGGFQQYYFNSAGDLAGHAVRAARGVGAQELAGIIEKANALFGKNGPDGNRGKRMDQLDAIDLKALSELDDRYYKSRESLGELLPTFAANNPEFFKPAK